MQHLISISHVDVSCLADLKPTPQESIYPRPTLTRIPPGLLYLAYRVQLGILLLEFVITRR